MKQLAILFSYLMLFAACNDNDAQRRVATQKDAARQEAFFKQLNSAWNFTVLTPSPLVQEQLRTWADWNLFISELTSKPVSSLSAFQKKATKLATRAALLQNNIPPKFATPEIKSRIAAVVASVRMLDMYLSVQQPPIERIKPLFSEINTAMSGLNTQFTEIAQRELVPIEKGEADMLRMLDTSRAIKATPVIR